MLSRELTLSMFISLVRESLISAKGETVENLLLVLLALNYRSQRVLVVGSSRDGLHETVCRVLRGMSSQSEALSQLTKKVEVLLLHQSEATINPKNTRVCGVENCSVEEEDFESWNDSTDKEPSVDFLKLNFQTAMLNVRQAATVASRVKPGGIIALTEIQQDWSKAAGRRFVDLITGNRSGTPFFEFEGTAFFRKRLDKNNEPMLSDEQTNEIGGFLEPHCELAQKLVAAESLLRVSENQSHAINLGRLRALQELDSIRRSWSWRITGGGGY